jgi:hypothetical protein
MGRLYRPDSELLALWFGRERPGSALRSTDVCARPMATANRSTPASDAPRRFFVPESQWRLRRHWKQSGDTWGRMLLKDHHEGYINWAEFERNQKQLAANAYGRTRGVKSGRGRRALLPGLLTPGRCGRRVSVVHTGRGQLRPAYRFDRPTLVLGLPRPLFLQRPPRRLSRARARQKILGRTRGAVTKLDADESVTLGLHIGESAEPCLAAWLARFRPVWALGSANAITTFPVLAGIEGITVLGEADDGGANNSAAQTCAARWIEADARPMVAPQVVARSRTQRVGRDHRQPIGQE